MFATRVMEDYLDIGTRVGVMVTNIRIIIKNNRLLVGCKHFQQ